MSDMKIAVWLRRESCADMVVNALCQIFVNRKLDKIFGNNFFSSIIRSGLPRIFSFGALPRKGRKMLCVFYHYNTKAFSCKAFFGTQSRRSGPVPILLPRVRSPGGAPRRSRTRSASASVKMLQLADKLVELNGTNKRPSMSME